VKGSAAAPNVEPIDGRLKVPCDRNRRPLVVRKMTGDEVVGLITAGDIKLDQCADKFDALVSTVDDREKRWQDREAAALADKTSRTR
jgi:hypothetical protein